MAFLTSFHHSSDNPNQFHILLLIFLHFDHQHLFFCCSLLFSSFLLHKVETFFFFSIASMDWFGVAVIKFIFKRVNNYISKECNLDKPKKWFSLHHCRARRELCIPRPGHVMCLEHSSLLYSRDQFGFWKKLICKIIRSRLILVFVVV